jgi:hypothetical protein
MAMNMNCMVTQSLYKQLDQVVIHLNEEKNVVEEKLPLFNDGAQFHTLKIIRYIVSRIPRIEEWLERYRMLFVAIIEPWETFICRVIR